MTLFSIQKNKAKRLVYGLTGLFLLVTYLIAVLSTTVSAQIGSGTFVFRNYDEDQPPAIEYHTSAVRGDPRELYIYVDGTEQPYKFKGVGTPEAASDDGKDWEIHVLYNEEGANDQISAMQNVAYFRADGTAAPRITVQGTSSFYQYFPDPPDNLDASREDRELAERNESEIDSEEASQSCADVGGALGWLMCPIVTMIDGALDFVDSQIHRLLQVDENLYNNDGIKEAWGKIRNIAFIILVPIMLVMVISTALGFEFISAYTVKKALPRFIIAVIFISISYPLFVFLIEFSHAVGRGILGILTSPFGDGVQGLSLSSMFEADETFVGGVLTFIMSMAAFTAGMIGIIVLFGSSFLLLAGTAFLILLLRQILIVAFLLLAPLAILSWIFQGNDKIWKFWWGTFSKLLMMFPIIMALIAVGRIFAFIILEPNQGSLQGAVLQPLMGISAYVLPYAFIPFTFKYAGGVLGNLAGIVNDKEKGLFDRQRQARAAKLERTAKDNLFRGAPRGSRREGVNRFAGGLMNIKEAGLNPASMRSRMAAARSERISAMSAEAAEKSTAVRTVMGNDDLLRAALHGSGTEAESRTYLHELGQRGIELEQNVASIRRARRDVGHEAFEDLAAANLAGTGTGYASGPAEMHETINRVAGSDRARAARILVSARGQAERARRVDLYGAGMATSADQLAQLYAGHTDAESANKVLTTEALNTKSAYEIGTGRNNALTNMVTPILTRVANAQAAVDAARRSGDTAAIARAEHDQKRIMAHTSAFLDVAGNASPENAQVIGAIMGQATASGETVGRTIQMLERDPEFRQYKKVYGAEEAGARGAAEATEAVTRPPEQPQ
jgi:hypothetical protein